MKIRPGISDFVRDEIIPRYDAFDMAHRRDHAETVIAAAMKIYDTAPEPLEDVMPEILYVAAACHDLGLAEGREHHHLASGLIIRRMPELKRWFSDDEIEVIAEAAEDHRASAKNMPRSMYGMIVAEADRLIVPELVIERTIQFGFAHYPELSEAQHIARTIEHLHEKYGRGGYLKLYIPWSDNALRLEN